MNFSRSEIDQRFQSQLAIAEILSFILYGIFFKQYFPNPTDPNTQSIVQDALTRYPFFQSIHLMVVLGFGLLLTFIQKHRITTMVTCLWVGCLSAQFYFIWNAFWTYFLTTNTAQMSMNHIIEGEFAAASVLIAVCAIIGKASNYQYFLLTMIFIPVYSLNEVVVLEILGARDIGGSMIIHTFGACFGLAVAYHLNYKNSKGHNKNLHTSQGAFTTALLGTVLLWALWPGFNGAQAANAFDLSLTVINTYLGLSASVIGTLLLTTFFFHGKFNLDQMANATLAGGVIMGSGADMIQSGFVANFVGFLGGAISTVLFQYAPPILQQNGLHDVAGIFNLHFIPGVIGGLLSVIYRAIWIDAGSGSQFMGVVVSVLLAAVAGNFTGKYIRVFHSTETANDFYNDFYFAHLEENVSDKLAYYEKNQKNGESELFDAANERASNLSERLLVGNSLEMKPNSQNH